MIFLLSDSGHPHPRRDARSVSSGAMEKRRLGRTGLRVSVLGFGGSEIAYEGASQATVDRLLGSALEAGLNVFDTAECYDKSEELIGAALGARRGQCLIFTKCGHARGSYGYEYSRRLQKLDYDFMKSRDAVATALRFTLSVPGVHTAIVGTARPGRFEENARHLEAGKLPAGDMKAIRTRWSEVADDSWVGQT